MPKSKSKRTARAVSIAGLPRHPALGAQDPFLEYRLGASLPLRLPDQENQPSAATVLRSEYTLGSDAAGNCVFGEHANILSAKLVWTVTAGSTGTAVATIHPQYTAFTGEARYARQIATRIQVLYIGTEQESSGYLSFIERPALADTDTQTIDSLHTASDIQVKATDGLIAFVDYTQTPRWEAPTQAAFMVATFPFAVFVASGLPASKTSLFRVKVERFMEYLPVEGSLAEGELKHEPHNPGAMVAQGALSGVRTSVYTPSLKGEFVKGVKEVANAAYHMAQPLLPYVVPKARQFLQEHAMQALPLMLGL